MSAPVRSPLAEQAEKLHALHRRLADGALLEPALTLAGSGTVWRGPINDAFLGWLQGDLDKWVRDQLAEGVRLVADSLAQRAQAEASAGGQPGLAPPAPPSPVGFVPPYPPVYGQIGGGEGNQFEVEEMRRLSHVLATAADDHVVAAAKELHGLLAPPPNSVASVNPIPPDAEAATGYPSAWLALAEQLRRAAADIAARADKVALAAAPLPVEGAPKGMWGKLMDVVRRAGDAAKRSPVAGPPSPAAARAAGKAGAEELINVARINERKDCPDYEEVERFLESSERAAGDPAYAQAFLATLQAADVKKYGMHEDGIESFFTKTRVCWLNDGKRSLEDYDRDIGNRLCRIAASATHSPDFSPALADRLFVTGGSGWQLLRDGSYSTTVTLLVAEKMLLRRDKNLGEDELALGVLVRNPEAAHQFAMEHSEVLAKLARQRADSNVPTLAGQALRLALVEYPLSLAQPGPWSLDGLTARAKAADSAGAEALKAAADIAAAVAKGTKLGPEGRLALAEYFAANIDKLASAANAGSGQTTELPIPPANLQLSFKAIMKDVEARTVLVTSANEAVAGWSRGFAAHVGDRLAGGEGDLLGLVAVIKDSDLSDAALDLGKLLGQLGSAVRANVKDEQQAASEVVGVISFMLSQGIGAVGGVAGTALGGGVGGLAAKYGSDRLAKLAADFISDAQRQSAVSDQSKLKDCFVQMIDETLEHLMACALWADERVRASLRAGLPPTCRPVTGPPLTSGDPPVLIVPPLEDPEGTLRVPAVDERPARDVFMDWLDGAGGGSYLRLAAQGAATKIRQSFRDAILDSLFKE